MCNKNKNKLRMQNGLGGSCEFIDEGEEMCNKMGVLGESVRGLLGAQGSELWGNPVSRRKHNAQ
jgi:hypothetical protein